MRLVKDILKAKGHDVWSVESSASVYDAVHLLAEKAIGALAVIDDGNLIGIISERDYARLIILKGKSSEDTPVRDIMTSDVITGSPSDEIEKCMSLMTEKRIRHLPIIDDGELIGMISLGDLVRAVIAEQQSTIVDLEKYISGQV
jgi:CBS domain-containing protein